MTKPDPNDEMLLRQIDDLLERGQPSASPLLNDLARLTPQADPDFQTNLEQKLVARLQKHLPETPVEAYALTPTLRPLAPRPKRPWLSWVAVAAIAFLGGVLLTLERSPQDEALPIPIHPISRTLVIATQNIRPGETITEDMVASISVSGEDFAEIQRSQPHREFSSDPEQVIGRRMMVATRAFEAFSPLSFKIGAQACPQHTSECLLIPEGEYTIQLPTPKTTLQTLIDGDRVDVLDAETQAVLVENVLLVEKQDAYVTLAAVSWKHSQLANVSRTQKSYALRLAETQASPSWDNTLIEYTITSQTGVPSYSPFDLVLTLPVPQSVQLVDSPYSLDSYAYTENGDGMNFWFKDLSVVRVPDQTSIVVRVTQSDAANLDYLLSQGASLSFIPGSGLPPTRAGYEAMSLPATSVLEDESQVDLLFTLPVSKQDVLDFPERFDQVVKRTQGNTLEFWLNDVTVSVSSDLIATFEAKPADVTNLQYLIAQGAQVFFMSADSAPLPLDRGYVALALPVPGPLPDADRFDIVLALPASALDSLTYPLEQIGMRRHEDTLEFWLLDVKPLKISTMEVFAKEVTALTIQVTPNDSVSLVHLLESGAEIRYLPANSAPPLIDDDKVVISIAVSGKMPKTPKFDIIWQTDISQEQFNKDLPQGLDQIRGRINGAGLEFFLYNAEVLNETALTSLKIDPASQSQTITLQVKPRDAMVIEYLIRNHQPMRFQASAEPASETTE